MSESCRCRNYTFIVYPKDLPDDFAYILACSGGKGFYIFHDMDKREDGSDKPAHYHVVIMFRNQRYLNSVRKLGLRCGAANGYVEPVGDLNDIARYLCHMDNPEKYQYKTEDVICFGGANYLGMCEVKTDKKVKQREVVRQMVKYICDNKIYSYAELFSYSCESREDWLEALLSLSIGRSIMEFIKSKNWTDNRAKYN